MSFIDIVPIEKDASFEANWSAYITGVVAACASDGLSSQEKSAVVDWALAQGVPLAIIEQSIAKAPNADMRLLGRNKSATFFGPYLVRDAIRMCKIDGLGEPEKAAIAKLAEAVHLSASQLAEIYGVVDRYDSALLGWKRILQR